MSQSKTEPEYILESQQEKITRFIHQSKVSNLILLAQVQDALKVSSKLDATLSIILGNILECLEAYQELEGV